MAATQQQIVEALTAAFTTTMGETVYDTSGPYDEPTPVMTITIAQDIPENAFVAGPTNTAHNITFNFNIWRQRANGPAVLRAMGDTALALHATFLPDANDGQAAIYCTDRGGVTVDDNNMFRLSQTWTYQGGF